jgi:exosortase F-associated protein
MLKILLTHKLRFVAAALLVLLLILVRAFEDRLFYDPFLNYFKSDFNNLPLPIYSPYRLFIGYLFRYGLNTIISLGLLYVLFKDVEIIKFAAILYLLFFMILIASFYMVINFYGVNNNLFLFYIRRFLIQPIFVLLFIPAFYFQKVNK